MFNSDSFRRHPVLISGAGPTGSTLALLLARAGVSVTIVEQNAAPQQHPAACILNTRTMEIFRDLGVASEILSICENIFDQANITWVVSLAGRELGRLSLQPPDREQVEAVSSAHTVKFPQHLLEPILWRHLDAHPNIAFHRQHELLEVGQSADGVTATILDRRSGTKRRIDCSWLVLCEGASSRVRSALGFSMDGPVLQDMIGIHFIADLGQWVSHRPSILYWILNRDLAGVLIGHRLPKEWVLFAPFFPPQQRPEDFTEDAARRLIRVAIGADVADLRILHIRPWTLAARLASMFREGRVFLAGDCAHSFPPTGGLGLNTGVQDAHNLAWKLAAFLKGHARPELLDTYESERRPIARTNLEHSVRNFWNMNELTRATGFDMGRLKWLAALRDSSAFRRLPLAWQTTAVKGLVRLGMRCLGRLDDPGPAGDRLRAGFHRLLPAQEPHYRYLGLDLGFSYTTGAVIPEPGAQPTSPDPVMDYLPTTWPGARLPHCWITDRQGRRSLHDLIDGQTYLLLIHPEGRAGWQETIDTIRGDVSMPVRLAVIGEEGAAPFVDERGSWRRLSGTEPTGAVLVRQDGHVAWRTPSLPADSAGTLRNVLEALGCR